MIQLNADYGLPLAHGMDRAAARLHHAATDGKSPERYQWNDLSDGARFYYRSAVAHVLRDIGPDPAVIMDLPLLWYSPSYGVMSAERGNWANTGRLVVALTLGDAVMALPDDSYPMAPLQTCRPGRSLDDIYRTAAPPRSCAA